MTVGSGATTATAAGLEPSTPYSFAVFARDLAGEYAAPATVTVGSLKVTFTVPAKVVRNSYVDVRGVVTDAATGAPFPGNIPVHVFAVPTRTGRLKDVGTVFTYPGRGTFHFMLAPPETAYLIAVAEGDRAFLSGTGTSRTIKVLSLVTLRTLGRMQPLGAYFGFKATVLPGSTTVPVVLQQKVGKKWKTVQKAKANKQGEALFNVKPTKRGKFQFRAKRAAVPGAAAGTSKSVTITVR